MAKTKVSQEVRERYNAKTYDRITIRTRKDDLPVEEIQKAADEIGKSLNSFVIDAVKKEMGIEVPDDK
jgi:uncharacterized protein (DUF1778 family)